MFKYSLYNLVRAYNDNSSLIHAHFNNNSIEGYHYSKKELKILGLYAEMFVFVLLISIAVWVWALIELVKNWSGMPDWAKFIGVIGLLGVVTGVGPVITLIAIYVTKK